MTTPKNVLPNWAAAQASPWTSVNQALYDIDQLMNISVLDVTLTAPPGGEMDGDAYIVADGATGVWSGHNNNLAYYVNGGYLYKSLPVGTVIYNVADAKHYVWNGSTYSEFGGGGGGGSIAVDDEGAEILASASRFNFIGASVAVSDAGFGVADITVTGSGDGTMGSGAWEFQENVGATGSDRVDIDISGYDEVMLHVKDISTVGSDIAYIHLSPDGGATVRDSSSPGSFTQIEPGGVFDGIGAPIGTGFTTGVVKGVVMLEALSLANSTYINSWSGPSGGAERRTALSVDNELHDTIILKSFNGTNFDSMDIDVFVRGSSVNNKIELLTGATHNGVEGTGTSQSQIGDVYQYTDANYRRVIVHMNQLGTDGALEITLPTGTFSKIVGAVQNSQTAEKTEGVAISYDNGVDPNKFTLNRKDEITGPLVLSVCVEGLL